MSQRSSEMPETTAQLVELLNYIVECRDVTMYDLKEKSRIAAANILFLMDHADLSGNKRKKNVLYINEKLTSSIII